jgi:hypothetical protein
MSLETFQLTLIAVIGFAVAGVCASGYQLVTERPVSFRLLARAAGLATFAVVPFLVFAAPFIIMRNTIRGRRIEARPVEFVMLATLIAASWSLGSGLMVISSLRALGLLAA